jgi:alkanesulfonate monooxygenase SsuD/methylene tetrahydromethanopterin reductase-like flavin-dependent oxidoreductase (luciferase family)
MEPEFRAVGSPYGRRGRTTDETLDFLQRCFAGDEVESNGQRLLFLPRPPRPPILVGGAPGVALPRAVRFGDGWMPILPRTGDAAALRAPIATLRAEMRTAGRPEPDVTVVTELPLDERAAATERLRAFAEVGATRVVHGWRYPDAAAFTRAAEALAALRA